MSRRFSCGSIEGGLSTDASVSALYEQNSHVTKQAGRRSDKSEKVWELYRENQEALQEAFDAGADTQSAVNDIVTPYNLPYQANDALKNHVPKLLDDDTYNASSLAD